MEESEEPDQRDAYLAQFDPLRDPKTDLVVESTHDYATRMQCSLLPRWPQEVLIEWFHRHARHIWQYAFLGFENLEFQLERWPAGRIPGREAFAREFRDDLRSVQQRADGGQWIARYMLEHGTWNTPIILLRNHDGE